MDLNDIIYSCEAAIAAVAYYYKVPYPHVPERVPCRLPPCRGLVRHRQR